MISADAQSHIEEIGNKIVFHQEQQTLGEAESMCGSHGGTHLVIRDFVVQEILADIPSLRYERFISSKFN